MSQNFTILGIESSCDETALAVLSGKAGEKPEILSHVLFSQIKEHSPYGGVVPEIAARAHAERMPALLKQTMDEANIGFSDLSGVAATYAPGLIGGVVVGLMTAKGIAVAANKPLITVNHLEGHALSPKITEDIAFPYLLLLVSGGHCQILIVHDIGVYTRLGTTIDDAVGEAYDKVAKMLSLGFPGGPHVEQYALRGNPSRFPLPRPLIHIKEPHFSFSGLKTAVVRTIEKGFIEKEQDICDLCASFQAAVSDCLYNRMQIAMHLFKEKTGLSKGACVVAGGVASNMTLRTMLENLSSENDFTFFAPPLKYCTDNGVMIAYAGLERLARGLTSSLDVKPRARQPLDLSAPAALT